MVRVLFFGCRRVSCKQGLSLGICFTSSVLPSLNELWRGFVSEMSIMCESCLLMMLLISGHCMSTWKAKDHEASDNAARESNTTVARASLWRLFARQSFSAIFLAVTCNDPLCIRHKCHFMGVSFVQKTSTLSMRLKILWWGWAWLCTEGSRVRFSPSKQFSCPGSWPSLPLTQSSGRWRNWSLSALFAYGPLVAHILSALVCLEPCVVPLGGCLGGMAPQNAGNQILQILQTGSHWPSSLLALVLQALVTNCAWKFLWPNSLELKVKEHAKYCEWNNIIKSMPLLESLKFRIWQNVFRLKKHIHAWQTAEAWDSQYLLLDPDIWYRLSPRHLLRNKALLLEQMCLTMSQHHQPISVLLESGSAWDHHHTRLWRGRQSSKEDMQGCNLSWSFYQLLRCGFFQGQNFCEVCQYMWPEVQMHHKTHQTNKSQSK